MSTEEAAIGLDSPAPRSTMPYSVSMPQTFRMATPETYRRPVTKPLQVLTGRHPLDGATAGGTVTLVTGDKRTDVHDALALLARDLRPVVGVGGVGQVLVLLVLLDDRGEQVVGADAAGAAGDQALDGQLLGPPDDV